MNNLLSSFVALGIVLLSSSVSADPLKTVEPSNDKTPCQQNSFKNFKVLKAWAEGAWGGGHIRKFAIKSGAKSVDVCYSMRTFTSGVSTSEITLWVALKDGSWKKIVGTGVLYEDLQVQAGPKGVSVFRLVPPSITEGEVDFTVDELMFIDNRLFFVE